MISTCHVLGFVEETLRYNYKEPGTMTLGLYWDNGKENEGLGFRVEGLGFRALKRGI